MDNGLIKCHKIKENKKIIKVKNILSIKKKYRNILRNLL